MKFLFSSILLRKILVIVGIYQCSFTCICPELAVMQFKFIAKSAIKSYEVIGIKGNKTFESMKFDIDSLNP